MMIVHGNNEHLYTTKGWDHGSELVTIWFKIREMHKNLSNFVVCFHMLFENQSMFEYENMNKLLQIFNV